VQAVEDLSRHVSTEAGTEYRAPRAALRRHMQWIKELQVQVADEHQRIADDEEQQDNWRSQEAKALALVAAGLMACLLFCAFTVACLACRLFRC